MGVSLINCQLMYETFSLIGFVLIAKGWCITRPNFHPNEWRTVIILMCSFYLASSSLLLIRRIVLSSIVFWLCTGLLYGELLRLTHTCRLYPSSACRLKPPASSM